MNTINLALGVLHVMTGAFFTTTGARKLFIADTQAKVRAMFDGHGVPWLAQNAVMAGELLGGLGLLFGALTHAAAAGLLIIMAGAYKLDTWPAVMSKQSPGYYGPGGVNDTWPAWSKLFSNALCTPEAQLIVILVALALAGAGSYSLDGLFWR